MKDWLGMERGRGRDPLSGERAVTVITEAIENPDPKRFDRGTRGECLGFGAGVKPAVYLDGFTLGDPMTVRDRFVQEGMNVECSRGAVVNADMVRERVRNEPRLARDVGWNPDQTAIEQFEESLLFQKRDRDNVRIGFILGIPGSAIRGFDRERKVLDEKGLVLPGQLFHFSQKKPVDPGWETWVGGMEDEDRASLRLMAEEYEMLDLYESSVDPADADRLSAEAHDDFFRKHDQTLRKIYRNYTNVTDEEASLMLSRRRKAINAPDGSEVYVFVTYGPEGRIAPDVKRLEAKVKDAFRRAEQIDGRESAA